MSSLPPTTVRANKSPQLSIGGAQCLCRSCGRYFGGVHGFDLHRRGGRCVDPETVGLHLSSDGFYRQRPPNGVGDLATFRQRVIRAGVAA